MIQYKTIISREPLTEAQLNEQGRDNWDNYAIVGNTWYFKRQAEIELVSAEVAEIKVECGFEIPETYTAPTKQKRKYNKR